MITKIIWFRYLEIDRCHKARHTKSKICNVKMSQKGESHLFINQPN